MSYILVYLFLLTRKTIEAAQGQWAPQPHLFSSLGTRAQFALTTDTQKLTAWRDQSSRKKNEKQTSTQLR